MTDDENQAIKAINNALENLAKIVTAKDEYGLWSTPADQRIIYLPSNKAARDYLKDQGYDMDEDYIEDMVEEVPKGQWVSSYAFD